MMALKLNEIGLIRQCVESVSRSDSKIFPQIFQSHLLLLFA